MSGAATLLLHQVARNSRLALGRDFGKIGLSGLSPNRQMTPDELAKDRENGEAYRRMALNYSEALKRSLKAIPARMAD